jgi:hypothetical protein
VSVSTGARIWSMELCAGGAQCTGALAPFVAFIKALSELGCEIRRFQGPGNWELGRANTRYQAAGSSSSKLRAGLSTKQGRGAWRNAQCGM